MSTWAKVITLLLVTIFFVTALHSSVTNAQITHSYGRGVYGPTSYLNYCSFFITIYSPNDQTTYVNKMLLLFNITWTTYPRFPFPDVPPALNGYYAYSIDKGPFVEVMLNQSANDVFYHRPENNFTINPSFSYLVDISHLEKGYHNIVINASLYHSLPPPHHFYFNMTTVPYKFLVGEPTATPTASPTATPTPTVPEFPILAILPLFAAVPLIATILLRRKRPSKDS
jgi:hypothetical protein